MQLDMTIAHLQTVAQGSSQKPSKVARKWLNLDASIPCKNADNSTSSLHLRLSALALGLARPLGCYVPR